MGIPAFFANIIKNYIKIIQTLTTHQTMGTQFHSLYMDCNSIIYDIFNGLHKRPDFKNEKEYIESTIINETIKKIEYYIHKTNPSNVIYITFDGVAPFAKMEQQRTRRYKSLFMSSLKTNNDKVSWSTNAITPGTNFMNNLTKHINYAFLSNETKYGVKQIIVSGSDIAGEGEHKLFQHLRNNLQPYDNVLVYGLDADLIMLSILHNELCNNIYVFREAPEFTKSKLNIKCGHDDLLFMDIGYFSKCILSEMACNFNDKYRIYDYIFLCFFLGNDFLPHFPSLNIRTQGINVLIDSYRKLLGNHPDRFFISNKTGKIQWKWVNLFLNEIAKNEFDLLLNEYSFRDKMDKYQWNQNNTEEDIEKILSNTPIIYRAKEKYICPQEKMWEERYYKILFSKERSDENLKAISLNYLEGLEWVFKYYTEGCPNWRWKYNYNYPPLFTDLIKYVPHYEMEFIQSNNNKPMHPNTQLAYVTPPSNHDILGNNIKKYLNNEYKHLYPEKLDFEWSFCRYFWESHVVLPEISDEVLNNWDNILRIM